MNYFIRVEDFNVKKIDFEIVNQLGITKIH